MIYELHAVIKNKKKYIEIFAQNSAFYSDFQIIWCRQISWFNLYIKMHNLDIKKFAENISPNNGCIYKHIFWRRFIIKTLLKNIKFL
jgi:hypothetical protein